MRIIILLLLSISLIAQDYEIITRERRLGNNLGLELWIKSNKYSNFDKVLLELGFNRDFLHNPDPYQQQNSITIDGNLSPYYNKTIYWIQNKNPIFSLYEEVTQEEDKLYFEIELENNSCTLSENQIYFLGTLQFEIKNYSKLTSETSSEFLINQSNSYIEYENYRYDIKLKQSQNKSIKGLDIIAPNSISSNVNFSNFPVFFERSGLIEPNFENIYGNSKLLSYKIEFSLDNGLSWQEILRFTEFTGTQNDLVLGGNNPEQYYNGKIVENYTGYFVTKYDGTNYASSTNYNGILKILSDISELPKNMDFMYRVCQLDNQTNQNIINREAINCFEPRTIFYNTTSIEPKIIQKSYILNNKFVLENYKQIKSVLLYDIVGNNIYRDTNPKDKYMVGSKN